jgi:hypothetical protein
MSTKLTKRCQEVDCDSVAQVNGYCRLHFLRLARTSKSKRRKSKEFESSDSSQELDPQLVSNQVDHWSKLDNDLTTLVEVSDLDPNQKKTGT